MSHFPRVRPSDQTVVPTDVTDILLWRLAVDVAAAHQPDDHGRCRNLQCDTIDGSCSPFTYANQALYLARRPARAHSVTAPAMPVVARGRAAVAAGRGPGGWFRATAA